MTGKYKAARPKGHAPWSPHRKTEAVLGQIAEVLVQYRAFWPLTIRQVFYRLVAIYSYKKTQRGYARLSDYINRGRRSGRIPWAAIRDDGIHRTNPPGWKSTGAFSHAVQEAAAAYTRNKSVNQARKVTILVEAAGMVPQIGQIASPYGVDVVSGSGFDSVTFKYMLAQEILKDHRQAVILHIGDFDPSGICIFDSMQADVEAFIGDSGSLRATFRRLALTEEQVSEYQLPTAPPKATEKRGNRMAETCQAEALPPDILAGIVDSAIRGYYDQVQFEEDQKTEDIERAALVEKYVEQEK